MSPVFTCTLNALAPKALSVNVLKPPGAKLNTRPFGRLRAGRVRGNALAVAVQRKKACRKKTLLFPKKPIL